MAVSKAQRRATEKYEKKSYDKILVRVPKGMKDKIKVRVQEIDRSINGYILDLIKKDLNEMD